MVVGLYGMTPVERFPNYSPLDTLRQGDSQRGSCGGAVVNYKNANQPSLCRNTKYTVERCRVSLIHNDLRGWTLYSWNCTRRAEGKACSRLSRNAFVLN